MPNTKNAACMNYYALLFLLLLPAQSAGMDMLYSCEGERFVFPWKFIWDGYYNGIAVFYKPNHSAKNSPYVIKEIESTSIAILNEKAARGQGTLEIVDVTVKDSGIYTYYRNLPDHTLHQGKLKVLESSVCRKEKQTLEDINFRVDEEEKSNNDVVTLEQTRLVDVEVTIPRTEQLPTITCKLSRSQSSSKDIDTEVVCTGSYLKDITCGMTWNASKDGHYVIKAELSHPAIEGEYVRTVYIQPFGGIQMSSTVIGVIILIVLLLIIVIAVIVIFCVCKKMGCLARCRPKCCKKEEEEEEDDFDEHVHAEEGSVKEQLETFIS